MVKKVELTINGVLKDEPIIYNIIKNFDVIPNIIEASFSTDMGWAVIEFEGGDEELERLFTFLREKQGIDIRNCD
jgi:ABC-type methionine transport system ATPase subunit